MKYRINGFDQIKSFYSIVFDQVYNIKPQHISLYNFFINQNNRNNWVEWFKCPYDLAMAGACIGSKKTYYKCLSDLQEWGFIQYEKGVNDWKAPKIKIEVLKRTSTDTSTVPLSEPLLEPLHEQLETLLHEPLPIHKYKLLNNNLKQITYNIEDVVLSLDKDIDSIIKQLNNEQLTIKQINKLKDIVSENSCDSDVNDTSNKDIEFIYGLYPAKCPIKQSSTGKSSKCKEKIKELLKTKDKEELENTIEKYLSDCKNSKTWVRNFKTFLNDLPDYTEEIQKDKDEKENYVYFKWHNDGSDIKPRKIEKDKADAYFANQLLGGYKAIIRKS